MLSALKAHAPSPDWVQPSLEPTHHGIFSGLQDLGQSQSYPRTTGAPRKYIHLGSDFTSPGADAGLTCKHLWRGVLARQHCSTVTLLEASPLHQNGRVRQPHAPEVPGLSWLDQENSLVLSFSTCEVILCQTLNLMKTMDFLTQRVLIWGLLSWMGFRALPPVPEIIIKISGYICM